VSPSRSLSLSLGGVVVPPSLPPSLPVEVPVEDEVADPHILVLTRADPTRAEDKVHEIRRLAKKVETYLGDESIVSGEELETLVSKVSGRG
jgi:hypothetical protein